MKPEGGFSEEQKEYLAGFTYGAELARALRGLPILSGSCAPATGTQIQLGPAAEAAPSLPAGPERIHWEAQQRVLDSGGKLSAEERAKRDKNPLDMWDEMAERAARGEFPKGTDVFLTKFHGLFYVAPAQNAYMCRLRIPGGELTAEQLAGLADLADRCGGGYLDVTTRANLQIREIAAEQAMQVLYGLRELGIINLGAGGDNVRNVTCSPLSGIDPDELLETLPYARRMHHYLLNHRELYGLPRKFNIAFDGGGRIASLEDTNDIGFQAVRVPDAAADDTLPAGIYFRLTLGGITGHRDFARDTGVVVSPDEAVELAGAILRVFIRHGDRTDRKKARLKYLLDAWGFDRFLEEVEQEWGRPLRRLKQPLPPRRGTEDRTAHVGAHRQAQPEKWYVGLVLPVGRITSEQARQVASIARRYGDGKLRLTVWQNLLITGIDTAHLAAVQAEVEACGLHHRATHPRAGLVACTGNAGCKYAGANTKLHALQIADYLEQRLDLDTPINIHVTGCHHSCAQHYIGDIGLIATGVEVGDDVVEGYHLHVGGGWGDRQGIGRVLLESVPAQEVPEFVCRLLSAYLEHRQGPHELFVDFAKRCSDEQLRGWVSQPAQQPLALA
ncbi:MAG: ferredoxin--nitrite reductase [Pirellulaceae bacterium]|nr:MAG: ferredoxin--nitrite reductase [Pirellulaceae bacterium]